VGVMSDFTVYKPRNGQILKNGRVMSASDLAVELTQLQATNERLTAELRKDGSCGPNYNTKLVAAAPDLYEALVQILGWRELRSGNEFPIKRVEGIAREALAKARGDE
jgi:hypothetical protein